MRDKLEKNMAAALTAFLVIAGGIAVFFALYKIRAIYSVFRSFMRVIEPFLVGLVIAFILAPAYNAIVKNMTSLLQKKLKKKAATYISITITIIFLFSLLILGILALINLVVPQFITSVLGIANSFDVYSNNFYNWLVSIFHNHPEITDRITDIYNNISTVLIDWINTKLTPDTESLLSSFGDVSAIFSGVFVGIRIIARIIKDILIGLIITVYFLVGKRHMFAQVKKIGYAFFKIKTFNFILDECSFVQRVFGGFVRGKLLDSMIIGLCCFFGSVIFNFPYPVVIGVVVGITNIIPFFGPFIGAVPCCILILMVNPIKALYFIIFILVLQQIDGNILGPRILGNTTGLSSFWVLFSIVVFGGLFGFVGMVIAVPMFAVIYSLIDMYVNHKLKLKDLPVSTNYYELLDHISEKDKEFLRTQDPTIK